MKWANANLFQGQWPVKSIDEAIALVRAKNRQLWSENIPGIDLDKANNDLVMGRNSPAVQDVSNAYRQFYGVKMPEQGAQPRFRGRYSGKDRLEGMSLEELLKEAHAARDRVLKLKADEMSQDAAARADFDAQIGNFMGELRTVVGDDVRIRLLDTYKVVNGNSAWGMVATDQMEAGGLYEYLKDTIHIYRQTSGAFVKMHSEFSEIRQALTHESVHRILRVSMDAKSLAVLNTRLARLRTYLTMGDMGSERNALAYEELLAEAGGRIIDARLAGKDPVESLVYKAFDIESLEPLSKPSKAVLQAANYVVKAFNRVFDTAERVVNLIQGRGFSSIESVFRAAAEGEMRVTDDLLRFERDRRINPNYQFSDKQLDRDMTLRSWNDNNWQGRPIVDDPFVTGGGMFSNHPIVQDLFDGAAGVSPTFGDPVDWARNTFSDLQYALSRVDGGKLKGVSKKALDAAEKGDPEQALAEATDYAKRRLAEIDNKIESIKQRAIEEGC